MANGIRWFFDMGPFGGNLQNEGSCGAIVFSDRTLVGALAHKPGTPVPCDDQGLNISGYPHGISF